MSKKKGIIPAASDGLVIDSSISLAWCFADEQGDYPQAVLDALTSQTAIVPSLWPIEVANVLLVGERRGRCSQADTIHWLNFLSAALSGRMHTSCGQAEQPFSRGLNFRLGSPRA